MLSSEILYVRWVSIIHISDAVTTDGQELSRRRRRVPECGYAAASQPGMVCDRGHLRYAMVDGWHMSVSLSPPFTDMLDYGSNTGITEHGGLSLFFCPPTPPGYVLCLGGGRLPLGE